MISEDITFPGTFRGQVIDANDPLKKNRVRVFIPSLGPGTIDEDQEFVAWYPVRISSSEHNSPIEGDMVRIQFGEFAADPTDGLVVGVETKEHENGDPVAPNPSLGIDDFPEDLGTNSDEFLNETGEWVEVFEPQSRYVAEDAHPTLTSREQQGLRQEFDPASGRVGWTTPKGGRLELSDNVLTAKASGVSITSRGSSRNFIHRDDTKFVGQTHFLKAKSEVKKTNSSKTITTNSELEADIQTKNIRIAEETTVGGSKTQTVGLNYKRAVGYSAEFTAFKEMRRIGGQSVEMIGGATAIDPISSAKTTGVVLGGLSDWLGSTSNRDFFFSSPGPRVRIGLSAPAPPLGFTFVNPLLNILLGNADVPIRLTKQQFVTELITMFSGLSGAMASFSEELFTVADNLDAMGVALETAAEIATVAVNPAMGKALTVASLEAIFAGIGLGFAGGTASTMSSFWATFASTFAAQVTAMGLLSSTWFTNYLSSD